MPAFFKFKKFLMGLLTDFSIVKTQIGKYKQLKGLETGRPSSSLPFFKFIGNESLFSNLFVNMIDMIISSLDPEAQLDNSSSTKQLLFNIT